MSFTGRIVVAALSIGLGLVGKKLRVNLELAEPIRHNDYNTRTGTITIWG
jgi:hypothetical protein